MTSEEKRALTIDQDVLSVTDADAAVNRRPGLRWVLMGPNLLFYLAGGQGHSQHFTEHPARPVTTWWKDLGSPEITSELKEKIVQAVPAEAGSSRWKVKKSTTSIVSSLM